MDLRTKEAGERRARAATGTTSGLAQFVDLRTKEAGERRERAATGTTSVLPSAWTFVPRKQAKDEQEPPQEPRQVLSSSWTFVPGERRERGATGSTSGLARGLTRLAALGTRSLGLQTASPVETRSEVTQTAIFTTDVGSWKLSRSIQGACRIELQRLQHRISHILRRLAAKIRRQLKVCPPALSKFRTTVSSLSRWTWTL